MVVKKAPYKLLIERKPNISYFIVFGCKCYIIKKVTRLNKFENKSDEGFLLGHSILSKVYWVYNKTHNILEEMHDVEFDEINGSQYKYDNLYDVRDIQLSN